MTAGVPRRGAQPLDYFSWAVEQHPRLSRPIAAQPWMDAPTLERLIASVESRDLTPGLSWRTDPFQVLSDPVDFLGRENEPWLSMREQTRSYQRLLVSFLSVLGGSRLGFSWLVALAIRGNLNRRLAIAGFAETIGAPLLTDHVRERRLRALSSPSEMSRWAALALDSPVGKVDAPSVASLAETYLVERL